MDCSICQRRKESRDTFHCPACARTALYPLRVQHATALLEKESLRKQVERIVTNVNTKDGLQSGPVPAVQNKKNFDHEQTLIDIEESRRRIDQISRQAESLKLNIAKAQQELEKMKAKMAKRRSDAKEAIAKMDARRTSMLSDISKTIRRTNLQYDKEYKDVISARVYLCKEVAKLAGLRQRQYKSEDGKFLEEYSLGGIPIIDLQDFTKTSPAHITASLTNISRLLILICGYLNLKLPAEITIPHNDYPLSTIFPPISSYTARNVPFPGMTPLSSTQNSPTASRSLDKRTNPRPRPLFIDRKITVLAREDAVAFGLFVEGATLLAWNVAWLCCVAGIKVENISSFGRNLWLLLGHTSKSKPEERPPRLGVWSHGTSHDFIGGSITPTDLKNWGTPMWIVDQVKTGLQADIYGAEWEMVDEKDLEADAKGRNGWTKLKSRGGPEP